MVNPQRNTNIISQAVGDGLGVFDPILQRTYALNPTSALVFQHADGQTTPQQLTDRLCQKFNMPRTQAEHVLWLALDELQKANLLQGAFTTTQAPQPLLSRRQLLGGMAAVGLSLTLLPLVMPGTAFAAEGNVFPTLQCVVNNGDGTYTAYFGYINTASSTVTIPYEPSHAKNMFTSEPKYRGQPNTFLPGTHNHVFAVVFNGSKITWMIKEDNASRQKVDADANSGCAIPLPTATPTATNTAVATNTPTATNTPIPTATVTNTPSPTTKPPVTGLP